MVIVLLIVVADKIKVAYPVVLVVAGLLISFIPGIPVLHIQPELIFIIFLPRSNRQHGKPEDDKGRCIVEQAFAFQNRRYASWHFHEFENGTRTHGIWWGHDTSEQESNS